MTENIYSRAEQKMNEYCVKRYQQYMRELISLDEYLSSTRAYIQCLMDNNLCGAGWAEQRIAEMHRRVL